MNPSDIRAALAKLGRSANKQLGQHFLIDRAALRAVVDAAKIEHGDRVFEIGPGLGVLTQELLLRGANVIAIERDRGLAAYLRERFAKELAEERLTLLDGDAADGDWLSAMEEGSWKLVANLPYGITSLALRLALWAKHPPTHVSVLVQREVAERIVDQEDTSLLSLMVGLRTKRVRFMRRVPPGAFFPPPKVDSAVLFMEVLSWEEGEAMWGVDPALVMSYAKRGFAHPRKFLTSNLGLDLTQKSAVVDMGLLLTCRAEELSRETWVKLAKVLSMQSA